MKRYKLLKDLAGLNAGSILYLNELGNLVAEDKTTIVFLASFIHFYDILDSDWFEEIPEDYKRWRADEEGLYWFVGNEGEVYEDLENREHIDNGRYELGNYFRTEAEAEKAVEWLKALTVLRDDTKGFKPNWNDPEQEKWFVFYDHNSRRFRSESNFACQAGNLYFASEDEANDSIKKHEQEWLTYLNVEE